MMFIVRWPAILGLLAMLMLCVLGALGAAGVLTGFEAPATGLERVDAQVADAQGAAERSVPADAGWIDVGLLGAAAVFFLISAIRLMRRTQGFWTWLLGFACYGGRWAWQQQQADGGVLATMQSIDIADMQPAALAADPASAATQVALLAIVLIVGLIIFIVDAADRAYWDRQAA